MTTPTTPIMTAETETIPEDVMAIAEDIRSRVFNAMHDDDGRLTDSDPAEIIASAILAEREATEARMAAVLKDPVAVRLNWMRGGINAGSIIAEERERCAKVAERYCSNYSRRREQERRGSDEAVQSASMAVACAHVARAIRNPTP